jgi:sugar diacid utilization regulator
MCAAKALSVHRTTLIYHLERLSDILDTDLRSLDPERRLIYLLPCIIVRGRGGMGNWISH